MSEISRQSVFSYPSPATKIPRTEISLREILDNYRDDNDLLKQILAAKAEEDKRRAEEEKYKTEAIRLQCKQVELEMLKEQKKPPTIFTGVPPMNTSSSFNVKSPSDIHSPYLSIPPPIDSHFSATTPTSATRLSPPSSANNSNSNSSGHENVSYNNNGISSQTHNYNQRPTLTLSIPSFPIITASPTAIHNQHSFSTPTSSVQEHHPHSASSTHHYSQSPTNINGNNKRTKLNSDSEVDHEYVMEALRQKVQRNQENPAKKFMNVLKPRSSSMPVAPHNSAPSSSTTTSSQHHSSSQHHQHHSHHQNREQQKHQAAVPTTPTATTTSHQRQSKIASPVDPPLARSPIPALPPMNIHSPGLNQEQVAKS